MTEEVYNRLREVEQTAALTAKEVDHLETELKRIEEKKLDPMCEQVNDMHKLVTHSRGFVGGVLFMAGLFWAAIGAAAAALWKYFNG